MQFVVLNLLFTDVVGATLYIKLMPVLEPIYLANGRKSSPNVKVNHSCPRTMVRILEDWSMDIENISSETPFDDRAKINFRILSE